MASHPAPQPEPLPRHDDVLSRYEPPSRPLEGVVRVLFGGDVTGVFAGVGNNFDAPLQWLEPEDLEYADTEQERAECRSDAEAQQARTESIFREAGIPMPTTLRERADTMVRPPGVKE